MDSRRLFFWLMLGVLILSPFSALALTEPGPTPTATPAATPSAQPRAIGFGEQDIRPLSELNVWPGEGNWGSLIISAYTCPEGVDPRVDASACTTQVELGPAAMWDSLTDHAESQGPRAINAYPVSDAGMTRLVRLLPGDYKLSKLESAAYPFTLVQGVGEDLTFDIQYAHGTTVKVYYLTADPHAGNETPKKPAVTEAIGNDIWPLSDFGYTTNNPGWGIIRVQVYTCHRGAPAVVDREACRFPVDINPDAWWESVSDPSINEGNSYSTDYQYDLAGEAYLVEVRPGAYVIEGIEWSRYAVVEVDGLNADGTIEVRPDSTTTITIYYAGEQ